MDRANRRDRAAVRHLLGAVMANPDRPDKTGPSLLDVVALLCEVPAHGLARGQVGTVVEDLGKDTLLVEFSDEEGRAFAITPLPGSDLLILHYVPQAA
jgi:hypothetical protein